jgi:hypothetical protein
MGKLAKPLEIFGTVLSAFGSIRGGKEAKKAADTEAARLRRQAGQTRASAQREALEVRRTSRYAQSRAQALAASSGGGASDPTVQNIIADLAGEGEYGALTALYEGEERALGMEDTATAVQREGRAKRTAGYLQGASTLLSGASSISEKYG